MNRKMIKTITLSAFGLHLIICSLITIIGESSPNASGFGFISFLFLYLITLPLINVILSCINFIADIIAVKTKRLQRIKSTSTACLSLGFGILISYFIMYGGRWFEFMKNQPTVVSDLVYYIGVPCTVAIWVLWIIDAVKRKNKTDKPTQPQKERYIYE